MLAANIQSLPANFHSWISPHDRNIVESLLFLCVCLCVSMCVSVCSVLLPALITLSPPHSNFFIWTVIFSIRHNWFSERTKDYSPKHSESCQKLTFTRHKPNIITISETWLHDNITDDEIEIENFVLYRADRSSRVGGVATYDASNLVSCHISTTVEPINFECLFIRAVSVNALIAIKLMQSIMR